MKRVHFNFSKSLSRRALLKGAGVSMALPWLEAMTPAFAASEASQPARSFVSVSLSLGLHGPNLNPVEAGRNYTPSLYLSGIKDVLPDLTIISGSSHPSVSGGHKAEGSILSAAPYSRSAVFKNTISIDQLLAKHLGNQTRFPSLVLNLTGTTSPSYTENGSMIPAENSPSRLFAKLFIDDSPEEQKRQAERLTQGRSIMDIVGLHSKQLERQLGKGDQEKMDHYFTSVRDFEKRLADSEDWARKPKPKVDAPPPIDVSDNSAVIDRKKMMLDVAHLALQTDSTRYITLHLDGNAGAIPIDGVSDGYHSLSHHGRDEDKIDQLTRIESQLVKTWGGFVRGLKETKEREGTMLDRTSVLLTSNLGNASAHDNSNMPVLFAGGGFRHGQHLAFDQKKNYPLPNLFLSLLHRQGIEAETFATSRSTMTGLELS